MVGVFSRTVTAKEEALGDPICGSSTCMVMVPGREVDVPSETVYVKLVEHGTGVAGGTYRTPQSGTAVEGSVMGTPGMVTRLPHAESGRSYTITLRQFHVHCF